MNLKTKGMCLKISHSQFRLCIQRFDDVVVVVVVFSWGLVQPGVVSVPELCHHMAEVWVSGLAFASNAVVFKQSNPAKVRPVDPCDLCTPVS